MTETSGQDEARRALACEIRKLGRIAWEDMRRQAIAACDAEIQTITDLGPNAGTCAGYGKITANNIIHRIRALPVPADLNEGGGK
jgi:nitrogenase subunit NifH